MPTVAPEATFEAVAQFSTGLTGTLGVRVTDNQGGTTMPRQTTGIAEFPAGSGIYSATLTAPAISGQYTLVWDDGAGGYAVDELLVTFGAPTSLTGTLYVTRDEIKNAQSIGSETYADDDIDLACDAASRAIDDACGRRFYESTDTRYYSGDPCDCTLDIDDLVTATSISMDTAGAGTFSRTLTEGTDFHFEPYNAPLKGYPYELLTLMENGSLRFPSYKRNVKIVGTFGWAAIPTEVRQYAKITATKLLIRTRQAPFGILSYGMDQPIAVRISRNDPDFERMLGHLVRARLFI